MMAGRRNGKNQRKSKKKLQNLVKPGNLTLALGCHQLKLGKTSNITLSLLGPLKIEKKPLVLQCSNIVRLYRILINLIPVKIGNSRES